MREIKFRAYDKEIDKMTYFEDENYDYRPPTVFRLEQVFKKDINYDDYESFEYNDITDKADIMQYTGLKDKNGKEIYEGDIVKTFTKEICVVEYNYNAFGLKVIDKNKPYGWVDFINHNIEVIGNIYDNLELLEK